MTTLCDNDFYIEFLTKLNLLYSQSLFSEDLPILYDLIEFFVVLIDTSRGLRQQIYLQYVSISIFFQFRQSFIHLAGKC